MRSAVGLWDSLRQSAGLQVSRNPKSLRGYDDVISTQLRMKLFGDAAGNFRKLIVERHISLDHLLTAFLQATAPFSRMLNRILQMYQAAAAVEGQENLKMVIQLDQMKRQKLEFDLEEFTKQVRAFEAATLSEQLRFWPQNEMWRLHSVLFPDGRAREDHISPSAPAADWLAHYKGNRTHEFPALPEFQKLGIDWVDELLLKLGDDLNAFLARGRELFGTYSNLSDPISVPVELDDPLWPASVVRVVAHDFWPATVVIGLQRLCDQLKEDPRSGTALSAMSEIRDLVDNLKTTRTTQEEKIKKLLDVLNLPVWKKREAMYSVWICAAALLDLRDCRVEYQVSNGCLEFPFRPRKIAIISQPEKPKQKIEFWSELRTPATELVGKRKSAIQPDSWATMARSICCS
jgi:hypothetical protein